MSAVERRSEIHLSSSLYPPRVACLSDPPKVLYVRGDPEALRGPALSIIGARKATPYGLALAEMAARVAAESGITVVSGGARGCDQAAGRAAIDAGGRHIAVLGGGADVVYPKSAGDLLESAIATGGAVVSLEPWGFEPLPYTFPKRNRVIAALSEALFVTEAGMPSGTFSTAEAAMELGREVLAAPGSILSPTSRGSNYLITVGACCIVDEDALEMAISRIYGVLRYCRARSEEGGAQQGGRELLGALVANPMGIDELAAATGRGVLECMEELSAMELEGQVERLPDGRFSPTKKALHGLTALGQNG